MMPKGIEDGSIIRVVEISWFRAGYSQLRLVRAAIQLILFEEYLQSRCTISPQR
jgi:hypothetical protein